MAGSLNKVMLIGNLGADPEIRTFQNGGKVCNLRIATSDRWRDKNTGENREKTEWHTVAIFAEGLVRICEQYLKKGSKVFIEGALQTRKWQDQSGNDRYSTEVVIQGYGGTLTMLDGRSGGKMLRVHRIILVELAVAHHQVLLIRQINLCLAQVILMMIFHFKI